MLLDIKQIRINIKQILKEAKEENTKDILKHLECLFPPEYSYMVGEQWIGPVKE